jgi:serine/threonine protein kinase
LEALPPSSVETTQVPAASGQETVVLKESTVAQLRDEIAGETRRAADDSLSAAPSTHPGYAPTIPMTASPIPKQDSPQPSPTGPAYAKTIPLTQSPFAQRPPTQRPVPAEPVPADGSPPPPAAITGSFLPPKPDEAEKPGKPSGDWREGNIIDSKYRVFGSARGAMGRVYFVDHLQWQTRLAIKTVLPQAGKVSEKRIKRFRRETEAWINLGKHPNLVTAFYLRQIEGRFCLFLEFVDGRGLDQWIQQAERPAFPEILDIAIQICDGMSHAHARGMVHRDLKPSNVLLSTDGLAKVTDFGLVKVEDEAGQAADGELPDSAVGTPAYMAPEQFEGSFAVDARADIYSFGLVLHMMIGKDYVFAPKEKMSKPKMFQFLRHSHQVVPPDPPKSRRPDTPDELDSLVLKCLAKSPEERYPDFHSLRAGLLRVYESVAKTPYPREDILAPELNSADLNNRALTFLDLARHDRALEFLEEAYEVDPGSPTVSANLATVWGAVQKHGPSLPACFETAKSAQGTIPDLAFRLADASLKLLRLEDASAFATKALERQPRDVNSLNLLAGVAHARGHLELATQRLKEALALEAENVSLLHNLAICQFEAGGLQAAADTVRRCAQLEPGDAELAADLAVVLAEGGRMEDAVNWCAYALRVDPDGFWPRLVGAEVLGGRRGSGDATRPDLALTLYRRLHQEFPLQWNVRLGLRDCLQVSGRPTQELLPRPPWDEAGIPDRVWARLVRVGRPSLFDLKALTAGKILFRETVETPGTQQAQRADEETRQRLLAAAPGSAFLSASPNGLWVLATEGNGLGLRRRDSLELMRTIPVDEGMPVAGRSSGVSQAGPADRSARTVWSLDSRFCLLQFADGSRRVLEFSTAADRHLSPFRLPSPPLLLDRSSSASETIELLRQRAELLHGAQAAEERWDHTEAFKLYRKVQALRGFERDFDAHAGTTRAANWITAPAGLRTGWERKRFPLRDQQAAIREVNVLGGGKRGLTLGNDGRLRFSDLVTGQVLWSLDTESGWVEQAAVSPESNSCLLLCSDRVLRFLNLNNQVIQPVFQVRTRHIQALSLAEDGRTFHSFAQNGDIEQWTVDPKLSVTQVLRLDPRWTTVLFASNRKSFLAFGPGQGALLGDCSTGETIQEIQFRRANEAEMVVCLSPSAEKLLMTGDDPGRLEVWDCRSGRRILTAGEGSQPITALATDSKGRHAVAGGKDGLIRLWELTSGKRLWTFSGHTAAVTALRFSPNDEFFLSGDSAGKLKFWAMDWAWEFER